MIHIDDTIQQIFFKFVSKKFQKCSIQRTVDKYGTKEQK